MPGPVAGMFFYLYLIVDIFSRKIVGWEVHEREGADPCMNSYCVLSWYRYVRCVTSSMRDGAADEEKSAVPLRSKTQHDSRKADQGTPFSIAHVRSNCTTDTFANCYTAARYLISKLLKLLG
jgi:hypothetical protein